MSLELTRTRQAGVRLLLVRRGVRFASEGRQCYFGRTTQVDPYLGHLTLDKVEDLLDVDLEPLSGTGEIPEASPAMNPVFLVCTHGRHDACCSIKGNVVSGTACAKPGDDTWECSHIGGDRFTANLVCFPHGVYYGHVPARPRRRPDG